MFCAIKFANDCIRARVLWFWKQTPCPLCQCTHKPSKIFTLSASYLCSSLLTESVDESALMVVGPTALISSKHQNLALADAN